MATFRGSGRDPARRSPSRDPAGHGLGGRPPACLHHGSRQYGDPDPELGYHDERSVHLSRLLAKPGDTLGYTYDFGDGWEHEIRLEQIIAGPADARLPRCVAGKGACPPEDCGGVWGYADLKEILADPSHEEHHNMLEWLGLDAGDDFDPASFSVDEVNARLEHLQGIGTRR